MVAGMQTARRRRTTWAISASLIAHVAVGIFLLAQHPTLVAPVSEPGPPQPIIPILLMPRTPPLPSGRLAPSQPIRLHRRPQPYATPDVTPAPIAPRAPPTPAVAPPAPKSLPALHPAPQPEGPKDEVRTVLRHSAVGCANAQAVGLNRAERDFCDERFAKAAKGVEFTGLGLNPEKQRLLDAAGAQKEADYRYKRAPMTPNVAPGSLNPGMSAEDRSRAMGSDKPSLVIPY
jgi:hypothetical protein